MNQLITAKRSQIIAAILDRNSIRATARMCEAAFNTVLKLVTLRVTPAMEPGVADHVSNIEEVTGLLDSR